MRTLDSGRWLLSILLALSVVATGCGDDDPAAPSDDGPTPLSFDNFQDASVVIGQVNMTTGDANAGSTTNGVGLSLPSGPVGGAFYVADAFNNRVMGYNGIPTADGAAASFIMGQPDATSNAAGVTAQNFSQPSDCLVAGGKLFLADSSNRRVLIWNSLPTSNAPASVVVGQPDFTTNTSVTTQAGMTTGWRVVVGGGKLIVADRNNNRVLIWNSIPTTNGEPADVVVGQVDFTSSTTGLTASTFGEPRALWTDGTRLVISDALNDRLLIWNSIPTTNGKAADVVVGAPDFTTAGSATASATSIESVWGVASDGTSLFVSDGSNHRVLIFKPFPTTNGAAAVGVLGQSNFTNSTGNDANQDGAVDANPTARTLRNPVGMRVIGNRLLVTDQSNNRVLVFNSK